MSLSVSQINENCSSCSPQITPEGLEISRIKTKAPLDPLMDSSVVSRYFIPGLTLYNGLTSEEILDLRKRFTENKIHPNSQEQQDLASPSFSGTMSNRFKNRVKQTMRKIHKKRVVGKNKILSLNNSKSLSLLDVSILKGKPQRKKFVSKSPKDSEVEMDSFSSTSCYNQFKTNQLSLLFDWTMNEQRELNPISFSFPKFNYTKFNSSVSQLFSDSNFSLSKENLLAKDIQPLSCSSFKKINMKESPDKNPVRGISGKNCDCKPQNNRTSKKIELHIANPSEIPSESEEAEPQTPPPEQVPMLSTVMTQSDSSMNLTTDSLSKTGSTTSSKVYSVPTFKEKREKLTIPKLMGQIKTGSIYLGSISPVNPTRLSYQNSKFYEHLSSDSHCKSNSSFTDLETNSLEEELNPGSIVIDISKIKFSEKSSLFVYNKTKRPLTVTSQPMKEVRSILKNSENKMGGKELRAAMSCDGVKMKEFLEEFQGAESKRMYAGLHNKTQRNKQLARYYEEEQTEISQRTRQCIQLQNGVEYTRRITGVGHIKKPPSLL